MIGLLWALVALFFAATLLAMWFRQRKLVAASQWPTARGKVIDVGIRTNSNGTYMPEISYTYVVADKGYASDRLRPVATGRNTVFLPPGPGKCDRVGLFERR